MMSIAICHEFTMKLSAVQRRETGQLIYDAIFVDTLSNEQELRFSGFLCII